MFTKRAIDTAGKHFVLTGYGCHNKSIFKKRLVKRRRAKLTGMIVVMVEVASQHDIKRLCSFICISSERSHKSAEADKN